MTDYSETFFEEHLWDTNWKVLAENLKQRAFKEQKINLTNIQSRPTKKNNWEYMFFIELDGHKSDKNVDIALKKISRLSLDLKVLGSYPKGI